VPIFVISTLPSEGGKAEIWTRIGDDEPGKQYLKDMEAAGVATHRVRCIVGASTTTSTILVDPEGERLVIPYYDPGMDTSVEWLQNHLQELDPTNCSCVLADVRWVEGAVALNPQPYTLSVSTYLQP